MNFIVLHRQLVDEQWSYWIVWGTATTRESAHRMVETATKDYVPLEREMTDWAVVEARWTYQGKGL